MCNILLKNKQITGLRASLAFGEDFAPLQNPHALDGVSSHYREGHQGPSATDRHPLSDPRCPVTSRQTLCDVTGSPGQSPGRGRDTGAT